MALSLWKLTAGNKAQCYEIIIPFQSAASWTWSHTYLSVPCIVLASSAVRQSVSSDHSLPGAEHTNAQEKGQVKRIKKMLTCLNMS